LAYRCKSRAHLRALTRTRIGTIDVARARAPDACSHADLIPPQEVPRYNPYCVSYTLPERVADAVRRSIDLATIAYFDRARFALASDQCALLFDPQGEFLAIVAYYGWRLRYLAVHARR